MERMIMAERGGPPCFSYQGETKDLQAKSLYEGETLDLALEKRRNSKEVRKKVAELQTGEDSLGRTRVCADNSRTMISRNSYYVNR
jgi:hypothetical protein